MNPSELATVLHIECHALRLIPNYKPSIFEAKINKWISSMFQSQCKECRDRALGIVKTEAPKSFWDKFFK